MDAEDEGRSRMCGEGELVRRELVEIEQLLPAIHQLDDVADALDVHLAEIGSGVRVDV